MLGKLDRKEGTNELLSPPSQAKRKRKKRKQGRQIKEGRKEGPSSYKKTKKNQRRCLWILEGIEEKTGALLFEVNYSQSGPTTKKQGER